MVSGARFHVTSGFINTARQLRTVPMFKTASCFCDKHAENLLAPTPPGAMRPEKGGMLRAGCARHS